MRVQNLGTGAESANGRYDNCSICGPWKYHWENNSGQIFSKQKCANEICDKSAEVGAHVKKVNNRDNDWYIVPFCKACNGQTQGTEFDVPEKYLIPVSKTFMCKRQKNTKSVADFFDEIQ